MRVKILLSYCSSLLWILFVFYEVVGQIMHIVGGLSYCFIWFLCGSVLSFWIFVFKFFYTNFFMQILKKGNYLCFAYTNHFIVFLVHFFSCKNIFSFCLTSFCCLFLTCYISITLGVQSCMNLWGFLLKYCWTMSVMFNVFC